MNSKVLAVLVIGIVASACHVENTTPSMVVNSTASFDSTKATLLKKGTLMGINHTASGVAAVYESEGKKVVVLNPYSSESGPDLKVYLSKDADAHDYLRLGNLKATSGMQTYEVPANTDLATYNYVHVWCEKYTVVFARAEVKTP